MLRRINIRSTIRPVNNFMKVCTKNIRVNPRESRKSQESQESQESRNDTFKCRDDCLKYKNDSKYYKNKYNDCNEKYEDLIKKYKDAYFEKSLPTAALIFTAGACSEALTGSGIGWATFVILLIM